MIEPGFGKSDHNLDLPTVQVAKGPTAVSIDRRRVEPLGIPAVCPLITGTELYFDYICPITDIIRWLHFII